MHSDTIPGDGPGRHMRGVSPRQQGDGRKPLPHIITGLLTLVLTLLAGHYSSILQGKPGAAGQTTVVTKAGQDYGVCAYFGKDPVTGHNRFQLFSPTQDAAGAWCPKGKLVSVVPGK